MHPTPAPEVPVLVAQALVAQRQFAGLLHRAGLPDPSRTRPGRSVLVEQLEQLLAEAGLGSGHVAVVVFDLDDSPARAQGLGGVAIEEGRARTVDRLTATARTGDVVGRAGSRAAALLCPGVPSRQVADDIAARMLTVLRPTVRTSLGVAVPLDVRSGVALSGQLSTAESLVQAAAAAVGR